MPQSRQRSEKFERSLKTRRAVVGEAYVEKALVSADDFTWPMQVLVTENCWEDISGIGPASIGAAAASSISA